MATTSLTPKQQRFVEEYLVDLNGTQAAIRAGYSKNTANEQASQLLAKLNIQTAVVELKKARSARTKIDADWVLTRLGAEVEADLADLYNEEGSLKPIHDWPLIWRQGLVSGVDVEQQYTAGENGEQIPDGVITKIKLPADRSAKRMELIGKHVTVQAFKDKVQVEGGISINIDDEDKDL